MITEVVMQKDQVSIKIPIFMLSIIAFMIIGGGGIT